MINPNPKIYWIETGDYLKIVEGFSPKDAARKAFSKVEPQEANLITEIKCFENGKLEVFYINTVDVMTAAGFHIN